MQVTVGELFECRLELFKVIVQDYREAFKQFSCPKRYQGFFLCGQMLDFLHWLLRRIVERSTLPDEGDWETLRQYDFTSTKFLDESSFLGKSDFRAKTIRVAKSKIDVEGEKSRRQKPPEVVASSVIRATFNPIFSRLEDQKFVLLPGSYLGTHPSNQI